VTRDVRERVIGAGGDGGVDCFADCAVNVVPVEVVLGFRV